MLHRDTCATRDRLGEGGGPLPVEAILLDLSRLPTETELTPVVAEYLAEAGSAVLHSQLPETNEVPARIEGEGRELAGRIRRRRVTDGVLASWGDPLEATEQGAAGVAALTARRVLGRIVFRRLPTGTGADYLMRPSDGAEGDDYERLECSGIAAGRQSALNRLEEKLRQLGRASDRRNGYAIVTDFGKNPVEIRYARWPR